MGGPREPRRNRGTGGGRGKTGDCTLNSDCECVLWTTRRSLCGVGELEIHVPLYGARRGWLSPLSCFEETRVQPREYPRARRPVYIFGTLPGSAVISPSSGPLRVRTLPRPRLRCDGPYGRIGRITSRFIAHNRGLMIGRDYLPENPWISTDISRLSRVYVPSVSHYR